MKGVVAEPPPTTGDSRAPPQLDIGGHPNPCGWPASHPKQLRWPHTSPGDL